MTYAETTAAAAASPGSAARRASAVAVRPHDAGVSRERTWAASVANCRDIYGGLDRAGSA